MKKLFALVVVLLVASPALLMGVSADKSAGGSATPYRVDAVHSTVIFRIKHMDVSYSYGRFTDIRGEYHIDKSDPSKSTVEVTLKTDSVDTANGKRDQHLRSPDFFNAKQFPTIGFASKSFKKTGDNTYEMTGDLTLHGVTKTIKVPLEWVGERPGGGRMGPRSGFECVFKIKGTDFGLPLGTGLGNDVRVIVSIEGMKPKS